MMTDNSAYATNDNHGVVRHVLSEAMLDLAGLLAEAYIAKLPQAANDNRALAREA
jgi:hypothetical protein